MRKSDYEALKRGPASYEGVTRMLREVQEERDALRARAAKAEQSLAALSTHPEPRHEHFFHPGEDQCRCGLRRQEVDAEQAGRLETDEREACEKAAREHDQREIRNHNRVSSYADFEAGWAARASLTEREAER